MQGSKDVELCNCDSNVCIIIPFLRQKERIIHDVVGPLVIQSESS